MRLVAAVCVCLVIAAVPSRARPYTGPDGSESAPTSIPTLVPLTDQSMQSFGLSAEETAIVAIFVFEPVGEPMQSPTILALC